MKTAMGWGFIRAGVAVVDVNLALAVDSPWAEGFIFVCAGLCLALACAQFYMAATWPKE